MSGFAVLYSTGIHGILKDNLDDTLQRRCGQRTKKKESGGYSTGSAGWREAFCARGYECRTKTKGKEMKHILICGERNSGKTELFDRLLKNCRLPVYGFTTGITETREDGYHEIYMFPAGSRDRIQREENHVGDCNMKERTVNLEVFNSYGVELLNKVCPDGIVAMDELGFMESEATAFCKRVLELLDGEIPVLATVKGGRTDVDFLNRVCSHPKAELFELRADNADELYKIISPIVESWSKRLECEN